MASGTAVSPVKTSAPTVTAQPLRIGFSWSLVGWVGYAGCQWLMLSVLAKLGSPALVGQFAFALAVSAPFFMFTNLQLRGVQSTDARDEYRFSDYITLRLIGSAIAVLSIAAVLPFLNVSRTALLVMLLVAIFKSLESMSDIIAGLLQKFERLDSAAIALLLRGCISVVMFGISFSIWRNLPIALGVWIFCAALVIVSYDFRVARKLAVSEGGWSLHFHWKTLRALTITSLPLGLVSAIGSFNTNIPRYAIRHVLSVADLGIYASIAYPVAAATIVANSLGQSALARMSRLFADGRIREFRNLVLKLVAFGSGIAVVAIGVVLACGNRLLAALYTSEYTKQGNLFLLLALTAGLSSIGCFLSYALSAARRFRVQLPISLACLLTTLICSILLVPRFGLIGAALSLLCSAAVVIAAAGTILARTISRRKTESPSFPGGSNA